MNYLVVIPARGGSKRVANKNLRLLGDKPLVNWTIDLAKKVFDKSTIIVSTDDERIATIAKNNGINVPWLRPEELSTDTARTVDVVIHAVNWYEEEYGPIDGIVLLQPTSPFRSEKTLKNALRLYELNNKKSIVTVSPSKSHPEWQYVIHNDRLMPLIPSAEQRLRSQELKTSLQLNGLIYIVKPSEIRNTKNFVNIDTIPLIVASEVESLDIDTELDFKIASMLSKEN
jgi:CMP-N,N'-diacetyllegionaminic acid synthase